MKDCSHFPTKITQSIFLGIVFIFKLKFHSCKFSGVTFSTDYKNNLGIFQHSTHKPHPIDFIKLRKESVRMYISIKLPIFLQRI